MNEYLIIGPSDAGKTGLLATLFHAAMRPESQVRVRPTSKAMENLFDQTQQTVRAGRLPILSTLNITEYTFVLELEYKRPWPLKNSREAVSFRMWDGPGGSIFRDSNSEEDFDEAVHLDFRQRLIEALRTADGFLLCVDATRPDRALPMFESLPAIMFETKCDRLPAERVGVCLTKIDALFQERRFDARRHAESQSPRARFNDLVPAATNSTLRNYLKPSALVGFNWTSVYGFLPNGEPNYDQPTDGLRINRNQPHSVREVVDKWVPFRVLDPFIFLASGRAGAHEIIKAEALR
jgi:hypothetical protein